jgi:hypothetical protein
MNEIGIGIIDVYSQEDLNNCWNSIPDDLKNSVYIISNTRNKIPKDYVNKFFRFDKEISLAAMRNRALTHFRCLEKKYYFLINSNHAVLDSNFFNKTIKTAANFGVWFMTGPGAGATVIEDDEKDLSLSISPQLNPEVLFLFSGIVKNCGYFNEQFYAGEDVDVLDYVHRLIGKNLILPRPFNCTLENLYKSTTKINMIKNKDHEKYMQQSYGLFYFLHKYIPGQNDPAGATSEELISELQKLQKKYAKAI